jgi:hypothetical protein
VSLLLEYGADLTATTDDGAVPIDLAFRDDIRELISQDERFRRDHRFKRAVEGRVGESCVGVGGVGVEGVDEEVDEDEEDSSDEDSSDGSCS